MIKKQSTIETVVLPLTKKDVAHALNVDETCIKEFNCTRIRLEINSLVGFNMFEKIENLYKDYTIRRIEALPGSYLNYRIDILIKDVDKFLNENNITHDEYGYQYYCDYISFYNSSKISLEFLINLRHFLKCDKFIMSGDGPRLKVCWE